MCWFKIQRVNNDFHDTTHAVKFQTNFDGNDPYTNSDRFVEREGRHGILEISSYTPHSYKRLIVLKKNESLCGNDGLRGLSSPGKSGTFSISLMMSAT